MGWLADWLQNNIVKPISKIGSSEVKSYWGPTPTPTATPTPTIQQPTPQELQMAIEKGANGPIATMAGQMVRNASASGMWKKDPFLAAVLPVVHGSLESSGFKNPKSVSAKSKFGWATGAKEYNPPNVETVLNDMQSATVGDRTMENEMKRNPKEAESRMNTYKTYQMLRDNPTDNLDAYFLKYAGPQTPENPYAGQPYVDNAKGPLNTFAELVDQIMKKRGASYPRRF
jgi:hypothetical protein